MIEHEILKGIWQQCTLRCRKIARMLFFKVFFQRFLGIIQVARLAMCDI
jgi:hypothetical protein